MTIFFYFDEISKMRILEPKNAFWKGAKKHEVKKVIKSKNDRNKSCPKFCKLVDDFFWRKKYFWADWKKLPLKGAKKHKVRNFISSSNQEMKIMKVVQHFKNKVTFFFHELEKWGFKSQKNASFEVSKRYKEKFITSKNDRN